MGPLVFRLIRTTRHLSPPPWDWNGAGRGELPKLGDGPLTLSTASAISQAVTFASHVNGTSHLLASAAGTGSRVLLCIFHILAYNILDTLWCIPVYCSDVIWQSLCSDHCKDCFIEFCLPSDHNQIFWYINIHISLPVMCTVYRFQVTTFEANGFQWMDAILTMIFLLTSFI